MQHKGNFFTGDLLSVTHLGWSEGHRAREVQVRQLLSLHTTLPRTALLASFSDSSFQRENHTHPHHQNQPAPIPREHCSSRTPYAAQNSKGHFSTATSKRFALFRDYSKLKHLGSYKNKTKQNHPQLSGSQRCCSQQQLQNFILPPFPAPGQGSPSLQITRAEETVRILFS